MEHVRGIRFDSSCRVRCMAGKRCRTHGCPISLSTTPTLLTPSLAFGSSLPSSPLDENFGKRSGLSDEFKSHFMKVSLSMAASPCKVLTATGPHEPGVTVGRHGIVSVPDCQIPRPDGASADSRRPTSDRGLVPSPHRGGAIGWTGRLP